MNPQANDLRSVLALLEQATPGEWHMYGGTNHGRVQTDDVFVCDGSPPHFMQPEDAKAIAAAVNFLRKHGAALLHGGGGEAVLNGKLVGWWNGISPGFDGEGNWSVRWGADGENSAHDIPLYDGYNPIHYTTPPPQPRGDMVLAFTDATIDKLQDVMAMHGFSVPVRVISDAFSTAMDCNSNRKALAAAPGEWSGEGECAKCGAPTDPDCGHVGDCNTTPPPPRQSELVKRAIEQAKETDGMTFNPELAATLQELKAASQSAPSAGSGELPEPSKAEQQVRARIAAAGDRIRVGSDLHLAEMLAMDLKALRRLATAGQGVGVDDATRAWMADVRRCLEDVSTEMRARGRGDDRFQRLIQRMPAAWLSAPTPEQRG